MPFYPDTKKHISPSALDNWLRNRSSFVKSYFEGEKTPETASMTTGKQVHKLIEGGFLKVQCQYDISEQEITVDLKNGVKVLGIPDSYTSEPQNGSVAFVDYKTGKASTWEEKLPTDVKMKATAWLVWHKTGCPETVKGAIEFIQTTWDPETKRVIPIDRKETELIEISYTGSELEEFTAVIEKAVEDVNDFYEKWKEKTDIFLNQEDIKKYIKLREKITALEEEQDEVAARIKTQMEVGGMVNHKTNAGTFYITQRKVYEYPSTLAFEVKGMVYNLESAELITNGAKVAQKNYELISEPKSESTSIGFRVAREK